MLQISTRGRYALRTMLDIALHGDGGPVGRQGIADRQEISAEYVAQLARGLRASGLLLGVKGAGGGYQLARDPVQIQVGDVLRAVEGPTMVSGCLDPGPGHACSRSADCVTRVLWDRLSKHIDQFLDAVTLQDLVDEAVTLAR